MNKEWILLHLREARQELDKAITNMESDPEYDEIELKLSLEHLYNHINTAWNSRNERMERVAKHSEADFYEWRAFPRDIQMD